MLRISFNLLRESRSVIFALNQDCRESFLVFSFFKNLACQWKRTKETKYIVKMNVLLISQAKRICQVTSWPSCEIALTHNDNLFYFSLFGVWGGVLFCVQKL